MKKMNLERIFEKNSWKTLKFIFEKESNNNENIITGIYLILQNDIHKDVELYLLIFYYYY